jgi:hypothetical protein
MLDIYVRIFKSSFQKKHITCLEFWQRLPSILKGDFNSASESINKDKSDCLPIFSKTAVQYFIDIKSKYEVMNSSLGQLVLLS